MRSALKSLQLDAFDYDADLKYLLKTEFENSIQFYSGNLKTRWEEEISLLFDFIIHTFPIITKGQTYGLELQNLIAMTNTGSGLSNRPLSAIQKAAYTIGRIASTWGWKRLNGFILNEGWAESDTDSIQFRLWKLVQQIELFFNTLSFINFILFLSNGKYPTLLTRILQISLQYKRAEMARYISLEFMNRQLVWQAFTEFFASILPFLQLQKLKRSIVGAFTKPSYDAIPLTHCLICFQNNRPSKDIHIPYITNCGHSFCYYCIQSSILAERNGYFQCPRCNSKVVSSKSI